MTLSIKRHREAAGMTQSDLAERIHVGRTVIANWETGVSLPRADILPSLAATLGCTIDDLYVAEPTDTA